MPVRERKCMISFSVYGRRVTLRFGFCMTLLFAFILTGDTLLPCFICCLLHECGHLAVCRILHVPVKELDFGYGGLCLQLGVNPDILPWVRSLLLHSAGILSNLLFAGIFALLSVLYEGAAVWLYVSLSLAVFHLIPVKELDGGRIWMLLGEKLFPSDKIVIWEMLGQGVSFLIFILFAVFALRAEQTEFAVFAGLFALCCICRPYFAVRK